MFEIKMSQAAPAEIPKIKEETVEFFKNLLNDNNETAKTESDKRELKDVKNIGRELTDEEKAYLHEKTGFSHEKIEQKCRMLPDGTIRYKTDAENMNGETASCGVAYKTKRFEYNGLRFEGVFPEFKSKYDMYLSGETWKKSYVAQFREANMDLKNAVEQNPFLKCKFTKEQLEDIKNGNTPRGYTWHHNEKPGLMQLVKVEEHDRRIGGAAHTGGNSIWGNNSEGFDYYGKKENRYDGKNM